MDATQMQAHPAYSRTHHNAWPACYGRCVDGGCMMLPEDKPGCCFAGWGSEYGMMMAAEADSEHQDDQRNAGVSSMLQPHPEHHGHDWVCWEGLYDQPYLYRHSDYLA